VKTQIEVDKVYHIVMVLDGDTDGGLTGTLKGYVNGALAAETDGVGQLDNHGNANGIGGINGVSFYVDEAKDGTLMGTDFLHFNGVVDEFAIFNTVLTDDQIAGRYEIGNFSAEPPAPPTISVVNNGDGTVTVTFEGKLQAATSVNGPWADVEGATSPLTIPSDQAAQFGRAVR